MRFKNIAKNSLFLKSFKLAKQNPSKIGLMILFDILFLISVFILFKLNGYFAQSIALPKSVSSLYILIVISLIYYLMVLFVYSFFKYSILDFIKSLFGKTQFSFNRLGQFYVLNIVIAGIFFAIMMTFNFILANSKQNYAPFIFIFLAIPYLLFLYIVVNIFHSIFYENSSINSTIKNGFKITFTKIKSYRETILIMILCAFLLWLLLFGGGYWIQSFASKDYNLYLTAYSYFKQISIIAFDMLFYFIILINRISFYSIAKEIK